MTNADAYFVGLLQVLLWPLGVVLAWRIFRNVIFSK